MKEAGSFNSYYIALTPVLDERSVTKARLKDRATANFNSLIHAKEDSDFKIKGDVYLEGKDSSSQIKSKSISTGGTSTIEEMVRGQAKGTKGHIECDGLLMDNNGKIKAIPKLEAEHPQTNLSHEAAIGKISQKELNYLMSRGLSEEDAKSLIIRGFLTLDYEKLPRPLKERVDLVSRRIVNKGTT